jgi:hypothetical protein
VISRYAVRQAVRPAPATGLVLPGTGDEAGECGGAVTVTVGGGSVRGWSRTVRDPQAATTDDTTTAAIAATADMRRVTDMMCSTGSKG